MKKFRYNYAIAQRAEWNRAVNQFMANGQVIPGYLYNGKWKVTVFSMQLQKLGLQYIRSNQDLIYTQINK